MKTHSVFIIADSPTPRLRGDAPKIKKAPLEPIVKTVYSRVCQPLLSHLKARTERGFRYAAAERILNPLVGAYANRCFRTRRHGLKGASGTPPRSGF